MHFPGVVFSANLITHDDMDEEKLCGLQKSLLWRDVAVFSFLHRTKKKTGLRKFEDMITLPHSTTAT